MLTVSRLSRKLNISKSLLYYLFQAKDFTPAELLNKIKMSRAMDLLKNKRVLVKEVSQTRDFILLIISYGCLNYTPGPHRENTENTFPGKNRWKNEKRFSGFIG